MDDEHNEDDEEEKETEKSIFVGSSTIWSNSSLDKEKEKTDHLNWSQLWMC